MGTLLTNSVVIFKFSNSIYSNFYPCNITIKNITFNCVEQVYQYSKAMLCGDINNAKMILATNDPIKMKRAGYLVIMNAVSYTHLTLPTKRIV